MKCERFSYIRLLNSIRLHWMELFNLVEQRVPGIMEHGISLMFRENRSNAFISTCNENVCACMREHATHSSRLNRAYPSGTSMFRKFFVSVTEWIAQEITKIKRPTSKLWNVTTKNEHRNAKKTIHYILDCFYLNIVKDSYFQHRILTIILCIYFVILHALLIKIAIFLYSTTSRPISIANINPIKIGFVHSSVAPIKCTKHIEIIWDVQTRKPHFMLMFMETGSWKLVRMTTEFAMSLETYSIFACHLMNENLNINPCLAACDRNIDNYAQSIAGVRSCSCKRV